MPPTFPIASSSNFFPYFAVNCLRMTSNSGISTRGAAYIRVEIHETRSGGHSLLNWINFILSLNSSQFRLKISYA